MSVIESGTQQLTNWPIKGVTYIKGDTVNLSLLASDLFISCFPVFLTFAYTSVMRMLGMDHNKFFNICRRINLCDVIA